VTINELLGEPDSFGIIIASQIDTILDVAVWTHDVGAVILHFLSPILEAVMINFAPDDGGVESYILLHLRNFSGLAQVAEVELAAPDKQKSGQPAALTARAFAVFAVTRTARRRPV
jgi:hypothetical protein